MFSDNLHNDLKTSLTCERDLPVEIWHHIFFLVCSDEFEEYVGMQGLSNDQGTPSLRLSGYYTPFRISHASRRWRDLATTYPILWSNVLISARCRRPDRLLDAWLTRSGSVLLFLWIDVHQDHPRLPKCLQVIRGVNSRWRQISLQLSEGRWHKLRPYLLQPEPEETTPGSGRSVQEEYVSLELLEASLNCGVEDDQDDLIFRFRRSKNLRTLKMGHFRDTIQPSSSDIPYIPYPMNIVQLSSIVNLTLSSQFLFPLIPFLDMIASLRQLQGLELRCCTLNKASTPENHRVTIPHLQRLSVVGWMSHSEVRTLFQCLLLPSLDSITMASALDTPSFSAMVSVSKCNIRHMSITSKQHISELIILGILMSAPFRQLEELYLDGPSIGNSLIMSLVRADDFGCGHSLKRITLLGCRSDDGLVADLAATRVGPGALEYLCVEVSDALENHRRDLDAVVRLQKLGPKGVFYSEKTSILLRFV
ncbi:hypothetical protein CVT24_012832 [Panaeolus cyanescens]|uniref:Uncharacterized protein n=1 Tax=Panaeolus cyanescens TaxID=181874 RepID=A0A409W6H7_9AGAR|nr:hypothetical protein CVT24_012832 [Panaeolus cyanescens]